MGIHNCIVLLLYEKLDSQLLCSPPAPLLLPLPVPHLRCFRSWYQEQCVLQTSPPSEQLKPSCRVPGCSMFCAGGLISSSFHLSADPNAILGHILNNVNPTKTSHSFKLDLGTMFHHRPPRQVGPDEGSSFWP